LPVVRRKRIERQDPDPQLRRSFNDALHYPRAFAVSEHPRLPARHRPPAIPVHDHTDVNALKAALYHKVNGYEEARFKAREPLRSALPCDRGTASVPAVLRASADNPFWACVR